MKIYHRNRTSVLTLWGNFAIMKKDMNLRRCCVMNNKKKFTIILAVLAVVCVFAVLVFSGVIGGNSRRGGEEASTDDNAVAMSDSYKTAVVASESGEQPYLPADMDGIYYKMTTDGAVTFYRYADHAFTPIDATGTYTATVTLSETDIEAEITYYQDGGAITGYGLYTAESGSYHLYPYALFHLTGYGSQYAGKSSKSCLLLVDTTEDDFYSSDKVYEESFIFNYADSSTSRSLTEASRTIGLNGAKRSDYFVLNAMTVEASVDHQLFFTGRQYAETDERVDLFRSGGSGNNTDNITIASDVLCNWVKAVDGGILYLTVDDKENVVLERFDTDKEASEIVHTFEGIKRDGILASGDYFYLISTNTIYSVADDKEIALAYDNASSLTVDSFTANGDVFTLRGYINQRVPAFLIGKTADGSVTESFENELFRDFINPIVESDGSVLVATGKDGTFTNYIF